MPTKYTIEDAPAPSKYTVEDGPATPPAPKPKSWQDRADEHIAEFARPRTAEEIHDQTKGALIRAKAPGGAVEQVEQTVQNVGRRAAGDVASMAVHPWDSLKSVYDTGKEIVTHPPPVFTGNWLTSEGRAKNDAAMEKWRAENNGPISDQVHSFHEAYKKDPRAALEGLSGDLLAMYASGKLLDAAGKPIKKFTGPLTEKLKTSVRKGAQNVVGAGERQVSRSVAAQAESANTAAETTTASNKEAEEKTLKERGQVDEANAETAGKDKAARQEVISKNRETERAHVAEKARIEEENRAALREREKRPPTKEKLDTASSELRGRVETARENATQIGNEKFNGVNEKLNTIPADMEKIHSLYGEANGVLGETQTEPPALSRLGKSIEHGESLSYKDLQAMYSELGKELSKGTLDGRVYHAYDMLHEGVGDEMQRIADSKGEGQSLTDARNYWRRLKQTFGKPLSFTDNATAAAKSANPDFVPDDAQANRMRLLGSYDPEIPKVVEHIGNLRKGLEALPKEGPLRDAVTVPPAKPTTEALPKPTPPKEYAEPHPTKPIEVPELSTREMRDKFVSEKLATWTNVTRFQASRLVAGPIATLIAAVTGHGGMEIVGAAYTAGEMTPFVLQRMMDSPAVREWFTRPPTGELETLRKLPNADRVKITDGLQMVVDKAQQDGKPIKISPEVARFLRNGVSLTGPMTQKLQQKSAEMRGAASQP